MMRDLNSVFSLFLIVMCLVMTYFMAFTDLKREDLDGAQRNLFIAILLGYALFRTYRLYKHYKNNRLKQHD